MKMVNRQDFMEQMLLNALIKLFTVFLALY